MATGRQLRMSLAVLSMVLLSMVLLSGPAAWAQQPGGRGGMASAEQFFKRQDANGDGKVTKEEYRGPPQLFGRLDRNGDGGITSEEFAAAIKQFVQRQGGNRPRNAAKMPEGVKVLRDVEYAKVGDASLKLDLYVPKQASASAAKPPLIVWIHGGAWRAGSKSGINRSFLRLTAEGYAAASIDYRLNGLRAHPEHIHDCKGAIRFLRANADKYGYDATRIGVGGGSAGGHLVALLGTSAAVKELEGDVGGHLDRSSRVQAVVDLFGPADFEYWASQSERFRENKNPELLKSGSPVTYITKDDAPLLIFHGDRDTTVPISQSERLHQRYQDARLESALHTIEGAGHGGTQFSDDERYQLIKAFLDKHIKQAKASQ